VRTFEAIDENQITEVEDLIETYYSLDQQFYISLDWIDEDGESMHVLAEHGKEFGFLFYSQRQDIEIEIDVF
jgi:hypothetical protein